MDSFLVGPAPSRAGHLRSMHSPAATTLATVERAQTFGPVAFAPMS